MKQFGNPPLSKTTHPFQRSPLFLSKFYMTPSLSKFQKRDTPPPNFRGEEAMKYSNILNVNKITMDTCKEKYIKKHNTNF